MKLTDQDVMPFGRHVGEKMEEVPASYLLYLWEDGLWRGGTGPSGKPQAVSDYIRENFARLQTECPNMIITHRP